MLPKLSLDLWQGHVFADMLPHDYQAMSMINCAITRMDITIIQRTKGIYTHTNTHDTHFVSFFPYTKLRHYDVIFCETLLLFLYV